MEIQTVPDRREQIQTAIDVAREMRIPLRVKVGVSVYNPNSISRNYLELRSANWKLKLDTADATPQRVEDIIEVIGKCVHAMVAEGAPEVLERLEGDETPTAAGAQP